MMIKPISLVNYKNFSFKKDEKKAESEPKTPSYSFDEPQIWFSTEIGPNGRQMMGSHLIGYSDVIGPEGTREPIFETSC